MKTNKLIAIFIAIVAIHNSNFCMEQQEKQWQILKPILVTSAKGKNKQLKKVLRNHSLNNYNTIHPRLQYKMLKTCIDQNNIRGLYHCLNHKFNPNRYHKRLSLLHYAIEKKNDGAIYYLSYANPDLIPLNDAQETPLAYARRLDYVECIDAMLYVITKKLKSLTENQHHHCGLTQHILQTGGCTPCIQSLLWQLFIHNCFYSSQPIYTEINSL